MVQARSPQPVPVDRVECARCRMLISSETGGGEVVSSSEETKFYDDIGCLAADWRAHHDGDHAFVRIGRGRWSEAQAASYAQPEGIQTAMASGFEAFVTAAEARAADRNGRALTFDDIIRPTGGAR
jgi:hypothetical protein